MNNAAHNDNSQGASTMQTITTKQLVDPTAPNFFRHDFTAIRDGKRLNVTGLGDSTISYNARPIGGGYPTPHIADVADCDIIWTVTAN